MEEQVIGKELTALRFGRVIPFTRSFEFDDTMEEIFDIIREQVKVDQTRYSQDWSTTGLQGLGNGTIRKASRVFDLFNMGMPGKDKPEDEVRENAMGAFYTYAYFLMLEKKIKLEEGSKDGRDYSGKRSDQDSQRAGSPVDSVSR